MSTFYIIFMLLLIVLPPVFKTIEKSLTNAGQDTKARRVREIRDIIFENQSDEDELEDDAPATSSYEGEVFPVFNYISEKELMLGQEEKTSSRQVSIPQELLEGGYMSVREIAEKKKAAQAVQVAMPSDERKERKIDPKKLVLYSEIMKTKF